MADKLYQMIADENELRWFFDHVIQKPNIYESYSMVWVSRRKKLTKEERIEFGLTTAESEFLKVETIRCGKVNSMDEPLTFTFDNFLKHVKRFNVDVGAYTTATGAPLPQKTLAVIFYINPCSEIKVADSVLEKLEDDKSRILTGVTNGKGWHELGQLYQSFGNIDSDIKHFRAQCKGTSYWMDFDIDVPAWFRKPEFNDTTYDYLLEKGLPAGSIFTVAQCPKYYRQMIEKLNARFGKGNYVIVSTGGGYHILVRTCAIKGNPNDFCREVEEIYKKGVTDGNPEYLDDKGAVKFEATMTSFKNRKTGETSIPGLPLPGTYQYGREVTVINKEDFE